MHHLGGNGYITMLDGELMLTANGVTTTYRAGDSFVEYPDGHYKGWNATNSPARLLVTYLVPEGTAVTTAEEEAPTTGPKTVSQAKHEITNAPAPFELIQTIQRYEAGDQTGPQSTAGDLLLTVVEGSLTARVEEDEKTYAAGESLTVPAGRMVATTNNGATPAVIATTELRPATLAIAPGTGRSTRLNDNWLLLATGSGTLLTGLMMRQRARHRQSPIH
jgi:quercetin dioxygenase-like cupin family protein